MVSVSVVDWKMRTGLSCCIRRIGNIPLCAMAQIPGVVGVIGWALPVRMNQW
jgi:hypothetical protein